MLFSIVLLSVLIAINGIFSASELAFLSLDKIKLKEQAEKGDKKAKSIKKILSNPSDFLSTIQIGITLAGFLASAFAADYFADYFLKLINISFLSPSVLRSILVIIITIVLSYFTLVFGELVPKKLAINNPYKIARTFVGIINIVRIVFSNLKWVYIFPIIAIFINCSTYNISDAKVSMVFILLFMFISYILIDIKTMAYTWISDNLKNIKSINKENREKIIDFVDSVIFFDKFIFFGYLIMMIRFVVILLEIH